MELLAPAGGKEQLEYAIRFGADAVYLACERFGMRRRASNFKVDDLVWVCAYAHERGVHVHLACNTVMHEADLRELPGFFEAAQASGVDALIISDMGAFSLARRHAPEVELHVSTQASVCNSAAALAWHELGAKRVVCAREMSLADIAAMHAELPDSLELEVFAHGSMCMSYSGRCIISDFLNGRPANGGHCTQPCRWEWKLEEPSRPGEEFTLEEDERATYLFSSRDLNMLEHLGELEAAGVDSVKLEGRGRGAFYAATVTGAYRRVLDGESAAEVAGELETVSHHPYGTGFFFGPAHQAPYLRQSQSEWMWVAEVLACEEVGESAGACESATDVGEPLGEGSGEFADAHVAMGACTRIAGTRTGAGAPAYQVTFRARNRFDCVSELEVLSPGRTSVPLHVRDLCWLPAAEAAGASVPGTPAVGPADTGDSAAPAVASVPGTPAARPADANGLAEPADANGLAEPADACGLVAPDLLAQPAPVPVDAVTRQMETYRLTCDVPLRPHDIIRARRKPSEMPPE